MTFAPSPSPVRIPSLDRRHLVVGGAIFLALELALFLFVVAGTHGLIVPLRHPTTTDFVSFYAAGELADAGTPQLAYDHGAHFAAEERATAKGIGYNIFNYPPVFLMVCAVLGRMPYLVAFVVFEAVTLAVYLLVAVRILGITGNFTARNLIPLVAFPPVFWTIGLGQNAFLSAALFGAATLYVDKKPLAAGLLFGGLTYKPHFAVLVPVALVAGRHWRALTGFLVSGLGLLSTSMLCFGWTTWHAFLIDATESVGFYQSGKVAFANFVTPFGAVRLFGGSPETGYLVQAAAATMAASLVAVVWYRCLPLPVRAAALATATLVAVPLALFYDLMLASIAGLWLLREDGCPHLPHWAKWTFAGLVVLSFNPRALAETWHLPAGALVSATLFAVVGAVACGAGARPSTVRRTAGEDVVTAPS
jgi:alpha-1,2-mannosyltransferase